MSGELGLQNTFYERVYRPLENYRSQPGSQEIDLETFIKTKAINNDGKPEGLLNTYNSQPVTLVDVFNDMGANPANLTFDNLLTLQNDMRYLAPEMIRQFILMGFNTDMSFQDLIAGTETVTSMTVTAPNITMVNSAPVKIGETETIPVGSMTWGHKTVQCSKYGKGLFIDDELMMSTPLPLMSYHFQRFGVMLSALLYNEAVLILKNGDQADGTDSAAVVGTGTGTTFVFADLLRIWLRARRIAMRWDNLVETEDTAWTTLQLDEFSKQIGTGGTQVTLNSRNRIIPSQLNHFISSQLGADEHLLFDKAQSMVQLMFRPLMVETERIILRQINGSVATLMCGWTTLNRHARIILDDSKAYSGNGFPDYMAPLV